MGIHVQNGEIAVLASHSKCQMLVRNSRRVSPEATPYVTTERSATKIADGVYVIIHKDAVLE
jgi:hypothetical protein